MTQKVSTNCLLFYPRTELCFSYSKVCSRRCWFCNLKEVITELNAFWSAIFLFSPFTCKRHIHFCLLLQNIIFFLSRIFIPIQQQQKKWSVLIILCIVRKHSLLTSDCHEACHIPRLVFFSQLSLKADTFLSHRGVS